tara:strand:- start:2673 stop:3065 length:393 start_codon:yes stop_codon:yes gene_type:complete
MANRSCNMKRKTVQAMLRVAMPRGQWLSARQILDRIQQKPPSLTGTGINASWKTFPSTTNSLSNKIRGMDGLMMERNTPHQPYRYQIAGNCEMCDVADSTTPEGLCEICFDELMNIKHHDYLAFMDEVSA